MVDKLSLFCFRIYFKSVHCPLRPNVCIDRLVWTTVHKRRVWIEHITPGGLLCISSRIRSDIGCILVSFFVMFAANKSLTFFSARLPTFYQCLGMCRRIDNISAQYVLHCNKLIVSLVLVQSINIHHVPFANPPLTM